jgi:hypothetical protein
MVDTGEEPVRPRLQDLLTWTALTLMLAAPSGCVQVGYDWKATDLSDGGPDDADLGADDAGPFADAPGLAPDAPTGPADAAPPPDASPPPPDAAPVLPDAATGCTTGCPKTVAFVDPAGTPQFGGTGGTAFAEACPTGQVIIGYDGGIEPNYGALGSIRATCGTVKITAGTLAVTITPQVALARHGSVTSPAWTRACPANMLIIGFTGHAGVLVDQLQFTCASLVVSGSTGSYTIGYGTQTTLAAIGDSGGTPFGPQMCPDGRVATADSGRAGSFVDAFAMLCSRPQLTF